MGDSAYSYSLTTFNKDGKLIQIEHALNCVRKLGKLTVGICATNGVVLATTKKLSPLVDRDSFPKVCQVTNTIGVCYAGMSPDYRVLLAKARKRAQVYYRKFQDNISTLQLTKQTAEVMQEFTQQGGVRPFGVSLLIAGFDPVEGPQLFQADATGAYFQWKATAIGNKFGSAKSFLERRLFANEGAGDIEGDKQGQGRDSSVEIEVDTAIDEAIRCLRQESEEDVKEDDLEIGVVDASGFHLVPKADLKVILDNLN